MVFAAVIDVIIIKNTVELIRMRSGVDSNTTALESLISTSKDNREICIKTKGKEDEESKIQKERLRKRREESSKGKKGSN
jgi:hypothetical protein